MRRFLTVLALAVFGLGCLAIVTFHDNAPWSWRRLVFPACLFIMAAWSCIASYRRDIMGRDNENLWTWYGVLVTLSMIPLLIWTNGSAWWLALGVLLFGVAQLDWRQWRQRATP